MSAIPETGARARVLALNHVSVRFDQTPVLNDVSWDWNWGQAVLVVGPSGAGKSTLAMLTAGLIPSAVEAQVSGSVWRDPRLEAAGGVGYVFQDPDSQFCQIRTGEEIAFGLENMAWPPSEMDGAVDDAIKNAGVAAAPDQEHLSLSGGNKQKLALACALAQQPAVVILDEPTANLDPASTEEVFLQIEALIHQGVTLLVIEHKFATLAERIPWMMVMDADGSIRRVGPTAEVLESEKSWMQAEGLWPSPPPPRADYAGAARGPVLRLEDVSFRYRKKAPLALSQVSCQIDPGELVALVGANGAGKSTLLKIMSGLARASGGRVERAPGGAAMGFQNPEHQFVFERVIDEVANRYVGDSAPPRAREMLERFRLTNEALHSPYALSQGQKRRLSVAVMLERERTLYCLDEPTFGQDAATRQIIMESLAERQLQGAAVVISTHDLDLVQYWATRVIVVDSGTLVFDGAWEDLAQRPDLLARCRLLYQAHTEEERAKTRTVFALPAASAANSLVGGLNPAWKLVSVAAAVTLTAFAHHLSQAIGLAVLPIVLLLFFSGLPLVSVLKRMAPFVGFFAMYTWMMSAYAYVGPHTPVVHVLWYRLSYPGFIDGLVLGLRMLSAVSFGLLFVSTVDIVDLVKSLCREFGVPPKFAYGTLAGLRFFPQFQEEWTKLRLARKSRGRDIGWSVGKIVTYALPLLSDAVRLSERVAIAMEARGFVGPAAQSPRARTYYHPSTTSWRDAAFGIVLVMLTVLSLWH